DQFPGINDSGLYLAAVATDRRQSCKDLRVSRMLGMCLLEDLEGTCALVHRVQGHTEDVAVAGVLWSQLRRAPQGAERLRLLPATHQEEAKRMVQRRVIRGYCQPLPQNCVAGCIPVLHPVEIRQIHIRWRK